MGGADYTSNLTATIVSHISNKSRNVNQTKLTQRTFNLRSIKEIWSDWFRIYNVYWQNRFHHVEQQCQNYRCVGSQSCAVLSFSLLRKDLPIQHSFTVDWRQDIFWPIWRLGSPSRRHEADEWMLHLMNHWLKVFNRKKIFRHWGSDHFKMNKL